MPSRIHAKVGTIRQLEILLAVYDLGSVKLASEQLHLTQPTVSIQLKKLSEAIDTPLYERIGKSRRFTDAGLEMVKTAREVLDSFARLDMELANLRGLKAGTLRIAVVTTSKYFIPHLLGPFLERYPHINVDFKVGNRQQIIDRFEDDLDDLYVFSHPPETAGVDITEFLPNPLVAIAASHHPLAGKKNLDIAALANEPFLMREEGSGTRFAIERHLQSINAKLNVRMTIESNEAIKHAVMSGLGISILSAHTLAFGGNTGLTELDVKQMPIDSMWYLVMPKNKQQSLITQTFLQFLKTEGQASVLNELAHRD